MAKYFQIPAVPLFTSSLEHLSLVDHPSLAGVISHVNIFRLVLLLLLYCEDIRLLRHYLSISKILTTQMFLFQLSWRLLRRLILALSDTVVTQSQDDERRFTSGNSMTVGPSPVSLPCLVLPKHSV